MLSLTNRSFRGGASVAALAVAGLSAAANAQVYNWTVLMDGPSEAPPNASPATGLALITWDTVAHTMTLDITFQGLLGGTSAAHIHGATSMTPGVGTAGVATTTPYFAGWPIGSTSGSYNIVLDMTLASSYNNAFITANGGTVAGAESTLLNLMLTNRAYFNIHSTAFPGGEIRGFIPTPGAAALLGLGGLIATRRRR